jgi:hypothetical protein
VDDEEYEVTAEEFTPLDDVCFIEGAVDGTFGCHFLWESTSARAAITLYYGKTFEEAEAWVHERWPTVRIIDKEEFKKRGQWGTWKRSADFGPRMVAQQRTGVPREPYQPKTFTPRPKKEFELLPGETVDTLIAPVAIAKRIGQPPQYLYHDISKGRLKAVGERPKKVRLGDVLEAYRLEVKSGDSDKERPSPDTEGTRFV